VNRPRKTRRLWLEELESRFLLSADIAPYATELPPFPETALHQAVVDVLQAATPAATAPVVPGRFELVFIDAGVPEYARLAADIEAQSDGWRHIEVVILDPERDGIAQVTEALAARMQLDAVHFITHGADGAVQLGASGFDARALAEHEATVAGWGESLKADGDLLFYGCDLAASARGEAFLARLAALTAADVAASANLTGAEALGGDWRLEFTMGMVEADVALSGFMQAAWGGLLVTQTLDWDQHEPTDAVPWADGTTSNTFAVGTETVTISVADPFGRLTDGTPRVSTQYNGGTGENTLRLQSSGFDVGETATVTLDFSDFAGGVSNVSFMIFDIDTSGNGSGFVDSVTITAFNGASINPTTVVVGGETLGGLGPYTAYNAFDGMNTVAGDTIVEQNSGNDEAFGNARFTFDASGITTVTIVYSNARTASGQGVGLHDISFDPTPVAGDDAYSVAEDGSLAVPALTGVLGNDSDPDNDPLSAVLVAGPANGVLALAGDGSFTYTPGPDFFGIATFTYRASDGVGLSTIATVTVTVTAVNDAPARTAGAVADLAVLEDSGTTGLGLGALSYITGPANEAAQTLTYTVTAVPAAALGDIVLTDGVTAVTAGSTYLLADIRGMQFRTALDAFGAGSFSFTVSDDGGVLNGGVDTLTESLDISVTGVNDSPTALADGGAGFGTDEDSAFTTGNVLANDTDPDTTDVLFVSALNTAGTAGLVTNNGDGTFDYDPNGAFESLAVGESTTDSFSYTVSDGNGGFSITTVTLTITGVNDATAVTVSGGGLSYTENDPATPVDGALTVVDVDNATLAGATIQFAGGTYQPGQDVLAFNNALLPGGVTASWDATTGTLSFTGTATVLQYQALLQSVAYLNTSDDPSAAPRTVSFAVDDGAALSAPATRNIAVTPANDAPALVTNQLTIGDGQTVVLTPGNLIVVDPDNPPTDISFSVSAVQHGRFELAGVPGIAVTTFTYVQLAAGQVQFVHAGSNQVPGYVVTPSDGALAGTAAPAAITFLPSLGTAGGYGGLGQAFGSGEDGLSVLVPPTPSTSSGASLASPTMSDAVPIPRGLADFEPIALPESPILAAPTRVALAPGDSGFAKIEPKADYEPLQVLRMPGPHVGLDFGRLAFEDLQGRADVEVALGAVKTAGLVLSVGAIWWATRAAGLLASALSALPAWRNFDPIFVVGRDEDDDFRWETPQDEESQREEEAVAETLDWARAPSPAAKPALTIARR